MKNQSTQVKQTAHTPGPWESYPHSTEPITTIIGNRTDGIAKVLASGNRELDTANARLIAAAPELLAALRNVTDSMLASRRLGRGLEVPTQFIDDARVAIAKAEGRA